MYSKTAEDRSRLLGRDCRCTSSILIIAKKLSTAAVVAFGRL